MLTLYTALKSTYIVKTYLFEIALNSLEFQMSRCVWTLCISYRFAMFTLKRCRLLLDNMSLDRYIVLLFLQEKRNTTKKAESSRLSLTSSMWWQVVSTAKNARLCGFMRRSKNMKTNCCFSPNQNCTDIQEYLWFLSLYITLNWCSYFVKKICYFGALFVKSTMFRPITYESWSQADIFMWLIGKCHRN